MSLSDWVRFPQEFGDWGRKADHWLQLVKAQINTNTTNISTNTTNISSNDTDISNLDTRVTDLEYDAGEHYALGVANANQAITTGVWTLMTVGNTVNTPTGWSWNTGTINTVTAPGPGLYLVEAQVQWASSNTGARGISLATDDGTSGTLALTTQSHRVTQFETMGNSGTFVQNVSGVYDIDGNEGESFGVFVFQSTGANLNVNSANGYTYLKVTKLR